MEKEIKLVEEQYHTITRSFSKKTNLANHLSGHDYESIDVFSSHGEQLPAGSPQEMIDNLSGKLFDLAKKDVEDSTVDAINEMKKKEGVSTDPIGEELEQIKDIIALFEFATTKEHLVEATEMVKQRKDKLNNSQLEYLRKISNRAANSIL